jgi:hypothetical protein
MTSAAELSAIQEDAVKRILSAVVYAELHGVHVQDIDAAVQAAISAGREYFPAGTNPYRRQAESTGSRPDVDALADEMFHGMAPTATPAAA